MVICLIFLFSIQGFGQKTSQEQKEKKTSWFESFSIRGYIQARYNRLLETNAQLKNEQGDK